MFSIAFSSRRSAVLSWMSTVRSTLVGDFVRKTIRSASVIASRRLWVTKTTAAGCKGQCVEQEKMQPNGRRLIQRNEGLVHEQNARLDDESAGKRHPPCHAERQTIGENAAHVTEPHLIEPVIDQRFGIDAAI